VKYGDRVQLRHVHSGGFVVMSDDPGDIPGSWRLNIDSVGSERSWVRFMPNDKARREGDDILYNDVSLLLLRGGHLNYYIHLAGNGEVCSYHKPNGWRPLLYTKNNIDMHKLRVGLPI
jgi:hypothetical protein